VVDPYLSYLSKQWNQGCHNARQLYEEVVTQGYTSSLRTREMQIPTFRPKQAHPVSKQTVTLDKPPSSRSTALMIVRPAQNRTSEQTAFLEQFIQSDSTVLFLASHPHGERSGQEQDDHPVDDQSSARKLADLPANGQRFLSEDQRGHQCHHRDIHEAERKEDYKEQPAATEAKGTVLNPHTEGTGISIMPGSEEKL
jgi:hypothetical protein